MAVAILLCLVLVVLSTLIHYEMLRGMGSWLPRVAWPARTRVIGVILGAFLAHACEILLYAVAIHFLGGAFGLGGLGAQDRYAFTTALYFSAETFTSLGYGDVLPNGSLRLLAGVEALNGLLLIGWSASFTYLAMERFWRDPAGENPPARS